MRSTVVRVMCSAVLICGIALVAVTSGYSLLWTLYSLAALVYWLVVGALWIAALLCLATLLLIIGFWLWPGELEITHITEEESA